MLIFCFPHSGLDYRGHLFLIIVRSKGAATILTPTPRQGLLRAAFLLMHERGFPAKEKKLSGG
jgi:hypothetical protein